MEMTKKPDNGGGPGVRVETEAIDRCRQKGQRLAGREECVT